MAKSSKTSAARSNRSTAWLLAFALAVLTIAAYSRVGSFEFLHYDDSLYVTEQHRVLTGLTWANIGWALTAFEAANWHPLTWLSHMIDVSLFGQSARGPHLVNVAIHLANTLLLFWVLRRMTGAEGRSAFVAALFAVHPLHVESVAWIAERKDVLSTFFGFAALAAYALYCEKRTAFRQAAIIVFFAMSLMAKAMWVTLPFLLLLLDYWPLKRIETANASKSSSTLPLSALIAEKIPLLLLSIASSVLTVIAQSRGGAVESAVNVPFLFRVANAIHAYAHYITDFFAPAGLAAFYPHPGLDVPWLAVAVASVVLMAITGGLLWISRDRRHGIVGWFWYLGTLVPVIGLVQVGAQAYADRYTYLPTIGLSIAVVWLACDVASTWKAPPQALASVAAFVSVLCAALTWQQSGHWRNDEALWRHALSVTDDNYRAHSNLGHALVRTKDAAYAEEALQHFTRSIELRPANPRTFVGLGRALDMLSRHDEAIKAYTTAIELDETHDTAYVNLAALLIKIRRASEAVVLLEKAVALNPYNPEAHNNLGSVYGIRGDFDLALRHFEEALRLRPGYEEAQVNIDLTLKLRSN